MTRMSSAAIGSSSYTIAPYGQMEVRWVQRDGDGMTNFEVDVPNLPLPGSVLYLAGYATHHDFSVIGPELAALYMLRIWGESVIGSVRMPTRVQMGGIDLFISKTQNT